MKNKKKKNLVIFYLLIFFLTSNFFSSQVVHSEPRAEQNHSNAQYRLFNIKDFFITTLYGTFLGSIVGTATLTFEKYPTKNLRRIAQGASIGLYISILFGLTSFYGNPSNELRENFENKEFAKNYKKYRYLFRNHQFKPYNLRSF